MLPWAHRSLRPKQHLNRFSHFCTAHSRVLSGMPGHVISPKNCTFALGDLDLNLIHGPLDPPESLIQNSILIGSAVFAQLTAESPYTLQWAVLFPSKLPLPIHGSGPHLIHDSLGPSEPIARCPPFFSSIHSGQANRLGTDQNFSYPLQHHPIMSLDGSCV